MKDKFLDWFEDRQTELYEKWFEDNHQQRDKFEEYCWEEFIDEVSSNDDYIYDTIKEEYIKDEE